MTVAINRKQVSLYIGFLPWGHPISPTLPKRFDLSGVAQTSCFSKSAAFPYGFTYKPQSFQKRETLRYLTRVLSVGARARQDPSRTNGFNERAVVALGLVRIHARKPRDCVVERFSASKVTGNSRGITRAGVSAG